jgi:polysaccharide biosynthesis transport protein
VQILVGLQTQVQSAQQALDSARQQKLYLESLLQQYQTAQTSGGVGESPVTSAETLDTELLAMRVRLQDLQSRYTERYPDILALKNTIAKTEVLKKQSETETAVGQKSGNAVPTVDPAAVAEAQHGSATLMMQVESQLRADQLQIANLQQHESDLESKITAYQARLNLTPETEQELMAVSRGYEESKSNYDALLQKQMESQLATNLEHQQGETFRVLDPPSLPMKPSGPNHAWFSISGLLLGASLGLALTMIAETTDVRVRQEEDLQELSRVT